MVLMLLVSDVILCDWLVIVFSTGLRDQSVNSLQSCQPFTHRIVCRPEAVLQRRYRGTQGVNITPWVFTVFWSVVIADAFASAFIITPPAAPSPIIIPFTNSTEVEM